MEHPTDSQPRDSRLEQFSATASYIIAAERGLTSVALNKIRHLAKQQSLSQEQVTECLDRIGDGSSTLGRVGRYEQLFLDRMANDLPKTPGAVLSPTIAQEAIRLATQEYQISPPRAQRLLDHAAKQRGLHQISAADVKRRIRLAIAEKFESPTLPRANFEAELVAHATNFGISADEVGAMIDTENHLRNQQRNRHNSCLAAVIAAILIAFCVTGASCWMWSNTETLQRPESSTAKPIVDSNVVEIKDAATASLPVTTFDPNKQTTDLSQSDQASLKFEINNLVSPGMSVPVLRFERWQKRFIELADRDEEQSLPSAAQPTLADRQKKKDAIEALQSEQSDERIQIRALDDLSSVAKRSDDITPEQARSIAAFCLGQHGTAIEIAILRTVKQFARWPNFLIAVSDSFAVGDQQSSADGWNQRVAFEMTDGKLKSNDDYSASIFAMARLRVGELLREDKKAQALRRKKSENELVNHLRLFISEEMSNRDHQNYFNRLIDARDLENPTMQRHIELQQILIEALLFAKLDDESLVVAETHFRNLNSATTLGAQLVQSRQAARKLVRLHLVAGASSHRGSRGLKAPATGRRVRDEAEKLIISGDGAQIAGAVERYRSAIACGDRAIIRSCLRGLIGIANSPMDLNCYQRQLDFVSGGQSGPYFESTGDDGQKNLSKAEIRAIIRKCQQLRQSRISEEGAAPATGKDGEVWLALNWVANRESPLSMSDLDLLLRIETDATRWLELNEVSRSPIDLPWQVQATLRSVEVIPLLPLPQ